MKAIVIDAPEQIRLIEVAIPIPRPDEVLVRSRAVGICGSDVELYKGSRPQGFYRYPLIPGHEWSGEVVELGERVRGLSAGERVVVEGFLSCGTCRNCRSGLNNLCQAGYDEIGFTRPGGLAEYVAVPARQVHILPPDASFQEAALLEPAAVVAQGFLQVKPRAAETIVVIGDGTIGLLSCTNSQPLQPRCPVPGGLPRRKIGRGTTTGRYPYDQ